MKFKNFRRILLLNLIKFNKFKSNLKFFRYNGDFYLNLKVRKIKCQEYVLLQENAHSVSHANNKTKKRFMVNLRTVRVVLENGEKVKIKVAASTLRTMKKASK